MRSNSIECDLFGSLLHPPSGWFFIFIFCCFIQFYSQNYFSTSCICKLYVIVCGIRSFKNNQSISFNRAAVFIFLLLFLLFLLWLASLPEQKSDYKPNRRFFRYTDQTAHAIEAIDMSTAIACLLFDEAIFVHFSLLVFLSYSSLTNLYFYLKIKREENIVHQNNLQL